MKSPLRFIAACALCGLLAACSGNTSDSPADAAPAAAAGLAPLAARTVDATALMDWAEGVYASYFPGHGTNQSWGPYTYRYYADTQNYLGVGTDNRVYVMGPVSGGPLAFVDDIANFACRVYPDDCKTTSAVDAKKLPIGDGKWSGTTPAVGVIYICNTNFQAQGVELGSAGPWVSADGKTWDSTAKVAVSGAVSWVSQFVTSVANGVRTITGNGLPSHTTGVFPIASTDPAYTYDRNNAKIAASSIAWGLPSSPTVNAAPTCIGGEVGVLLTGVRLNSAIDSVGRDAPAHEVQDACQGHPQNTGIYHYHNVSSCVQADTPGQHSPLVGYAYDGFGIYGNLGENGVALSNADLDVCHGHTHAVTVNGVSVSQFHYHATKEFPYSVGCYRGTPSRDAR